MGDSSSTYALFRSLVEPRDLVVYGGFRCEVRRSALDGTEVAYWLLQGAFAWFLDKAEWGFEGLEAFRTAQLAAPHDSFALFWFAYAEWALKGWTPASVGQFREAERGLVRPYAALVLGRRHYGLKEFGIADSKFKEVLALVPNFLGAAFDLMRTCCGLGDVPRAVAAANVILAVSPFEETRFGVMNGYVNDVFTMSSQRLDICNEAAQLLASPAEYWPKLT